MGASESTTDAFCDVPGSGRTHQQAAASDDAIEGVDADYRLAWKATDEICVEGTLRDETLQQLLARHGNTMTRKIILIISWFNLLSCFINGCRVPLETSDKIGNVLVSAGDRHASHCLRCHGVCRTRSPAANS
jgi:hypothetical protein